MNKNTFILLLVKIAILLLTPGFGLLAATIDGKILDSDHSIQIIFTWSNDSLRYQVETDPPRLTLVFNEPVELSNKKEIENSAQPWLDNLEITEQSIIIEGIGIIDIEAKQIDNGVRIKMRKSPVHYAITDSFKLEKVLARITHDAKRGQVKDALEKLDSLAEREADDIPILIAKAEILYYTGKRGEAIETIIEAEVLDPQNPLVKQLKNRFLLSEKPFVKTELAYKATNSSLVENFLRVHIDTKPFSWLTLGAKIAEREIARNSTGSTTTLENEIRQLELYYLIENKDVFFTSMSLYVNERTFLGLSREFSFSGTNYSVTFGFDINRPNWDFFTSQVIEGKKHRVFLDYYQKFKRSFRLTLKGALNQYMYDDLSESPSSFNLNGNVSFQASDLFSINGWIGETSQLTIGYEFELEDPIHSADTTILESYSLLRRNHGPKVNVGKRLGEWDILGELGYTFRPRGNNGYFMAGRVEYGRETENSFFLDIQQYIDPHLNDVAQVTVGAQWIF